MGYVLDVSRFATDGYREHGTADRDQSLAKLTYAPDAESRVMLIANGFSQQAQDPQGTTWQRFTTDPRSVEEAALLYNTRKSMDRPRVGPATNVASARIFSSSWPMPASVR